MAIPDILGICRFSFLGRSDWRAWRTPGIPREAIARDLYDPLRIERRLRSFQHLTLASVAAQGRDDFRLLVLTSPDLPNWAMARLRAMLAGVRQAELLVSSAGSVTEALAPVIAQTPDLVQFRVDDDDALAGDFIATLRLHAGRMRGFDSWCLSLAHGLVVNNFDDSPTEFYECEVAFRSQGLAARMPPGRDVFRWNHGVMARHMTALQVRGGNHHIQQRWDGRDSEPGADRVPSWLRAAPPDRIARIMARRFAHLEGLDWTMLRAADWTPPPPPGPSQPA